MTHSRTGAKSGGEGPLCLLCRLMPVTPDAPAGLCVSCRFSVRDGLFGPVPTPDGLGLIHIHRTLCGPLGREDNGPAYVYPFTPEDLFPDGATAAELAAVRGQLIDLASGPKVCNRKIAKEIIKAIRASGCRVAIDSGYGGVDLSHPERVPYTVLVKYVRFVPWIEDALTRETARRLKREEEEYARKVREADEAAEQAGELFT